MEESKINPKFNLEDFLSDLLSFEKYVAEGDYPKYEVSKNKIFDLIISNTSYDYDESYLKHSAFINTVSHILLPFNTTEAPAPANTIILP